MEMKARVSLQSWIEIILIVLGLWDRTA